MFLLRRNKPVTERNSVGDLFKDQPCWVLGLRALQNEGKAGERKRDVDPKWVLQPGGLKLLLHSCFSLCRGRRLFCIRK